jgi:ABC-type lipoprotein export system ATPase subunit
MSVALVAQGEPTVATEPGDRSFDFPAVGAEPFAGLDAAACDAGGDASFAEPDPDLFVVISLVCAEFMWSPSAWPAARADGGDALDERPQGLAVVDVGAVDRQHEGQTVGVGEHVDLRTVLNSVARVRAGQRAPFFARRLAPSTIAADQSISPAAPCESRIPRCTHTHTHTHTPAAVQAWKRRCAVGGDTKLSGRCRHAQPVVSTNTIAVNTARSSIAAVPPPWRRRTNSGINGSTISHNESGTNRRDSESATPTTIPQQPHLPQQKRRTNHAHVRHALSGLNLDISPSEIHVLLGQNGSGKSTLIKLLSGFHKPDDGAEVHVSGQALVFGSPASARDLGCRFVHQDLGLVDSLPVLDNLIFGSGSPTSGGTVRTKHALQRARDMLGLIDLDLDPRLQVGYLSAAQKTEVAIARALDFGPAVRPAALVPDEPTAALPTNEVERLLGRLRVAAGGTDCLRGAGHNNRRSEWPHHREAWRRLIYCNAGFRIDADSAVYDGHRRGRPAGNFE